MKSLKEFFWLLLIVSVSVVMTERVGSAQQSDWKLVPVKNNPAPTNMDFESLGLLTEILNAIDVVNPLFSEIELESLRSIKTQFHEPLHLDNTLRGEGVDVDLDVVFAMRAQKSAGLLSLTSQVLGDKIYPVLHVVNRRRMGAFEGVPEIGGHRMADLLDLDRRQKETLTSLASQFDKTSKDASKTLAEQLTKLAKEYRTRMALTLEDDDRRWFNSTFGEPIGLLDENGRSVFFELIERYDQSPASNILESVSSFVVESDSGQSAESDFDDRSSHEKVSEKLVIDAVDHALIRSDIVQEKIGLSDTQSKAIRDAFAGKTVELTNEERNSRLAKLIAGDSIVRPDFLNSLSSSQITRLDQIEIQTRTSGNHDSFGLLDDLVAAHLKLKADIRSEITNLAKEYTAKLKELLDQNRDKSRAVLTDYQEKSFGVLSESQKRNFESYFGPIK